MELQNREGRTADQEWNARSHHVGREQEFVRRAAGDVLRNSLRLWWRNARVLKSPPSGGGGERVARRVSAALVRRLR